MRIFAFGFGLGVGLGAGVAPGLGVGVGLDCAPHGVNVAEDVRGFGTVERRSLRLLFVSVQPLLGRVSERFEAGTGAGEPSEHVLVP